MDVVKKLNVTLPVKCVNPKMWLMDRHIKKNHVVGILETIASFVHKLKRLIVNSFISFSEFLTTIIEDSSQVIAKDSNTPFIPGVEQLATLSICKVLSGGS